MKYTFFLTLFFAYTIAFAQDPWKDIYRESAWEQRDTWQRADEVIKKLHLSPGSKVGDIGCHEGYFTVKLAKAVTPSGKVYAVDINKSKVEKLKEHLAKRKLTNVEVILGEEDNPKLPPLLLDAVLIVDTYHEMDEHQKILEHIKKSLKPGGRILLCEPISDERIKLTREEQEKKHELGMNYAREDLTQAGFTIIFQQQAFVDRVKEKGDKMWLIVGEKVN